MHARTKFFVRVSYRAIHGIGAPEQRKASLNARVSRVRRATCEVDTANEPGQPDVPVTALAARPARQRTDERPSTQYVPETLVADEKPDTMIAGWEDGRPICPRRRATGLPRPALGCANESSESYAT
jgi:hypothetical protein